MFSLRTKRAIYLTKTHCQLNCKLHDILMPVHVKSDSCKCSGVGIFSLEEMSWKTSYICVSLFHVHIFPSGYWKIFHSPVGAYLKKLILDPEHRWLLRLFCILCCWNFSETWCTSCGCRTHYRCVHIVIKREFFLSTFYMDLKLSRMKFPSKYNLEQFLNVRMLSRNNPLWKEAHLKM